MNELLIITGDNSADQYAAEVINSLREKGFKQQIYAAAGEHTSATGANLVENLVDHAVVGFMEIITSLPYYFSLAGKLEKLVRERDISAVLFLDFPGFNLRMAKRLKKYDVQLFYYIPPQVWAWGESRVEKLKQWFTELFVIFPFEVDFYHRQGVKANFVGHPRFSKWQDKRSLALREELEIENEVKIISFFPGSRKKEIERHLDQMIEVAAIIRQNFSRWEPVFSLASTVNDLVRKKLDGRFKTWEADSYSLLHHSDFTVLTSGTVTMEATFTRTPMVASYRTSWSSYLLSRWLVEAEKIAMPNYLSDSEPVPELIQNDFTVENLYQIVEKYLTESSCREKQRQYLVEITSEFNNLNPAHKVADSLLKYVGGEDE